MTDIKRFAADLLNLSVDEMIANYDVGDFDSSLIPEIVEEIKRQGNLEKLVDPDPKWDPADCNDYLIRTGPSSYLYFEAERGGRLRQMEFSDLEAGITQKLKSKFVVFRGEAQRLARVNVIRKFEQVSCAKVIKSHSFKDGFVCLVDFRKENASPPDTNIFRLDIAGNVVWRIERFKEDSAGSATYYTDFWSDANDHWHAFHPLGLGFDCTFDINTGRIIKYEFM